MKDPKKEEIRQVLLGRVEPTADGELTPLPKGQWMLPVGIVDGAASVRFLGVTRRVRRYETKRGKVWALSVAGKAMENLGRGLALREQPEAVACLIRYVLTRPVALTFAYEDGAPTLTAWTGRGLGAWLAVRRAVKAFERGLPDDMAPVEVTPEKSDGEKKPDKKGKKAKGT